LQNTEGWGFPSDCQLSAVSCQPLLLHLSLPTKPGRPA
jgi:hypothetical protein